MEFEPKGPEAARLRQRKFALLRQFPLPQDLLPGSLSVSYTRCGKPTCHCAQGEGHAAWSLTFMAAGKKRVERIPKDWVDDVRRRAAADRDFQDALRQVLTANAELLVLRRQQRGPLKGPHVRQIQNYAYHSLGLKSYFQRPGDGRFRPRIPARDLVWAVVIGHILRVASFLR